MTAVAATHALVAPAAEPRRPGMARAAWAFARWELAAQIQGRTLPAFTALFAMSTLAIAGAGLSASGSVTLQGFARTAVSLLQLVLWVVPLVALADAALAAAEGYDLETLAAQPVSRGTLVVGRALGRFLALAVALLAGLGVAGLVIAGSAGTGDGWRFAGLAGTTLALAAACVAVGTLAGVLARTRTRALAAAVGLWFGLTIGVDLAAVTFLATLPRAELSWSLTALLLLSPVDTARALAAGLFGAEAVAGPMGAALRRVLGPGGLALLAAGLVAWTTGALACAARLFAARDL